MVACGVFLLFLSRKQPLRSRSAAPFICLLAYICCIVTQFIISQLEKDVIAYSYCSWVTFLGLGAQTVGYLFSILNFGRFLLINNLNKFKERFWKVKDGTIKPKWWFVVLTRLTTGFWMNILAATICVVIYTWWSILGVFWNWDCRTLYGIGASAMGLILSGIVGIGFFILIFFDLILNWKMVLKCQWRKYFITTDPYLFRLEKSSFPLFFVILVVSGALNNPGFGTYATPPLGNTVVQSLFVQWVMIFDIYFIIVATIVTMIIERIRQCRTGSKDSIDSSDSPLAIVMSNEELYALFLQYAKNEWSAEVTQLNTNIESPYY